MKRGKKTARHYKAVIRESSLKARLSKAEYARLQANAMLAGLSVSKLVRDRMADLINPSPIPAMTPAATTRT